MQAATTGNRSGPIARTFRHRNFQPRSFDDHGRDQLLLLRRYNTGYEDGKYSVVAGHLDGNETVIAAMRREAREECGITLDDDALHIVQVMHRLSDDSERIDVFLTASWWEGTLHNHEPEKRDQLHWVHVDQLPDNTIPYVRVAIAAWRAGHPFTSYGFPS